MAAFNFPNAPTLNQVFTPVAGVSYVWTGGQWDRMLPTVMTIPPGVYMPYGGATEPLGWLFCDGRALARSAYPLLFAAIGIAHGAGDGTTTFNLPDMRGRAAFGRDDMGGTAAGRLTNAGVGNSGINGALLGAAGGLDRYALALTQAPAHAHGGTTEINNVGHTHTGLTGLENQNHSHWIAGATDVQGSHRHIYKSSNANDGGSGSQYQNTATLQSDSWTDYGGDHAHNIAFSSGTVSANHNHYFTTDGQSANHVHAFSSDSRGGGEAHPIVPPALVANYIIFTGA